MFSQHGYRGSSVREICSRAGVSANAITYHFGSKEKLYRHILDSFASLQFEHAETVLSADPGSHQEFVIRMEVFFEQLLDAYIENRETLVIMSREFEQLLPAGDDGVVGAMMKTSFAISDFITRAKNLGFVRADADPEIVAGLLVDRLVNQALFVDSHNLFFKTSTLDPDCSSRHRHSTPTIARTGCGQRLGSFSTASAAGIGPAHNQRENQNARGTYY